MGSFTVSFYNSEYIKRMHHYILEKQKIGVIRMNKQIKIRKISSL